MRQRRVYAVAAALVLGVSLTACSSKADKASQNLSTAADNFEIQRQIVFYNGITGDNIAEIDGRCSIGNNDRPGQVTVTCETGPNEYEKHFLGLSDNVTWFALQSSPAAVSVYHTRFIWKPKNIIPDIGIENSGQ